VEVAKALGGSFKFVMLAPRTVRVMTQLPKETQKNGDTDKSKRTNKHAKHKPRLNMQQQKTLGNFDQNYYVLNKCGNMLATESVGTYLPL